ncbi:Protein CBG25797 [Caenorhabditis briggsae]|nr:Protein CBG25797 [Caenorhabditis briggsae]CAR99050.1 Protein CBG25797 [Caenorhabditis briggsae]
MKIARRRRCQERARRRKMRKTQHELIMLKARDTMLHCQRTARVCIEVQVLNVIRKAERRRQKMELELMEQELLKALGLSENSDEKKIEELPPEKKF